ncbi:PLC-like phosphodiesterase [Pholiota conissans]|uniref:PLC-like phosphodiesterase n=1 Tax=Pholiota conissans TaxID=109636 RepID=A0A9P6CVX8_9AGAR|nr:PLC-like phosphodiesterase [Pholiota conissans]
MLRSKLRVFVTAVLVTGAWAIPKPPGQAFLGQQALDDLAQRAAPIAGFDTGCSKSAKTCDWMAKFPDNTKLVHMNLPGTHDTSTWNYTDATQASLLRYTGPIPPAEVYRCQEDSILQSLNDGIRVFDLRVAYNPGNDTLGFHHSAALLSPTTRVEDVFFGLYNWLDNHPTEAVLVSINHESGTGTPEDSQFYEKLYGIINAPVAQKYWVQVNGTLGTLGEARGKLTLLQRYSYDLLPSNLTKRIGIPLDPQHWTDNGKIIELVYNVAKNQIAFIEDFYDITRSLPLGSGTAAYIEAKFDAVTAHLTNATRTDLNPDQLYISFASAAFIDDTPFVTPEIFALGDGAGNLGMGQRLLPWLKARKGQRFGIIMFDFYDGVPGLVEAAIGL